MSYITVNELKPFVEQVTKWHEQQVEQLNMVLAHPEAEIRLSEELTITAGSDLQKGFHAGIILSLGLLGKLPFKENEPEDAEASEPDE